MAKNIQDMNKSQLRRHVQALWREENRLLEPYDCGQSIAEYIGPARIREIRLELEAIEEECGRRNHQMKTQGDRAYLARLAYNDAQERGAERCRECGPTDPWYPRCNLHEPMP